MATEEAPPHGRSSSRAIRAVKVISASEQTSFFGSRSGKRSQQKTDKLVWFSPVHSPLLSPAREKSLQATKKKVRQSSIFSIHSRGKGSLEAEEPTSPKVSCIGQVRAHKKDKDPFADAIKKKNSQSKPGSMSPARFFASPGRFSLFGSRKDSGSATPSSSGYGEGEPSCFGWPFESRSALQTDKTCAFLARSLDLFQDGGNSGSTFNDKVTQPCADASGHQLKKLGSIRATADGYFGICTHDEIDPHACTTTRDSDSISLVQGASAYDMSGVSLVDEKQHGGKKLISKLESCHHSGFEKSSHEELYHEKPADSKQRLTYEELPSLHCSASTKQNMKISVEIVPETWLWRNGERLRTASTSHLSRVSEQSVSTSRDDSEKAQHDEVNLPVSPCGDGQPDTREGEECIDHQIMSQTTGSGMVEKDGKSGISSIEASSIAVDYTAGKPINVNEKVKTDADYASLTESSQSHSAPSPCCIPEATLKGNSEERKNSASSPGEYNGGKSGKQQLLSVMLQTEADGEKNCNMLGTFDIKPGHQIVRRVGVDVGKENYSIALPPLLQKNLPSLHPSREDGKRSWSIFKSRKSEPFSAQPFSALILVGYDQSSASKDMRCNDEELLKGLVEVGRLSFHGSGKFFQVLNSDAAFNRSRSATSHRTVIRLQRCNSDPCRPSY